MSSLAELKDDLGGRDLPAPRAARGRVERCRLRAQRPRLQIPAGTAAAKVPAARGAAMAARTADPTLQFLVLASSSPRPAAIGAVAFPEDKAAVCDPSSSRPPPRH